MTPIRSPESLSSEDDEEQQCLSHEHLPEQQDASSKPSTPLSGSHGGQPPKPSMPMQKRRRVTRACDECRRKKIKCDGKQPCTHCTVYSYECTYDQPSNRRRNPAPAYIEALESRLQKAEAILRTVLPGVNLEDPKFDAHGVDQIIDSARHAKTDVASIQPAIKAARSTDARDDDAQLQTMVEGTGSLDLDDQGHWDYHGNSSSYAFMRNLRHQFGDLFVPDSRLPFSRSRAMSHLIESPKTASSSPYDSSICHTAELPDRRTAMQLCRNTLEDACSLMRFVHKPQFYGKVNRIFDTDPENYTNTDTQFLPLLYVVMAVGCLFAQTEDTTLDTHGYESAMEQGFRYFQVVRNMLDITDCRDLTTLQAIVFMILFLQSTAKLATCYSHIGIALRACCRLGLHRNIKIHFNPIEQEERKRIFWLIRKMDAYVGALLGLPKMLSEEDVDQQLPIEVDDEFITTTEILPMPAGKFSLIRASNAHTKLTCILEKVVKFIYPIKGVECVNPGEPYSISHSKIREIEKDLQIWMDDLPMELRPSDDAPPELARVQQLLRLSYAHLQMMMYRPFLHYVSQSHESRNVDKRSYACAAACVSVARNIVHITAEMKRRGLLIGSYWFVMYTSYFAILSLVFFVFENPQSPTGNAIMKDATEGRDMLASLARRSLAADRCTHSLKGLFADLPVKLKQRKSQSQSMPTSRKRPNPTLEVAHKDHQSVPTVSRITNNRAPNRASTFPNGKTMESTLQSVPSLNSAGVRAALNDSPSLQSGQHHLECASVMPGSELADKRQLVGEERTSQQTLFGQQLSNNLLDLGSLIYPSTNPFAYGNQPLSILEDTQMMTPEQQTSLGGSTPAFTIPGSTHSPQNVDFDHFSNPPFKASQPQAMYQHDRSVVTTPQTRTLPSYHLPQPTSTQETGNLNLDEEFWQQMAKGRTVLTPGINLDELFGSDGGWNSVYMDQGFGRTQQ